MVLCWAAGPRKKLGNGPVSVPAAHAYVFHVKHPLLFFFLHSDLLTDVPIGITEWGFSFRRGGIMVTQYIVDKAVEQVLGILMPSNRLAMRVILQTGLRISDVLSLQPMQVKRQFYVTEQKTGKRRRVNLPDSLVRDLLANSNGYWCFPHRLDPKRHRTRQAVWADVKRAARAYRIAQNVGTHTARKVYAVHLRNKYGDLKRVQRALNHDSEYITMLYAMADTLVDQKVRHFHS